MDSNELNRPKAAVDVAAHDGLPVKGYQPQSGANVALVNSNKVLEERVLRQVDTLSAGDARQIDMRWLAIARTHIEQGFMAMNRAVFRPARVALPEDDDPRGEPPKAA